MAMKPTAAITGGYHCYQLHQNFIRYSCFKVNSIHRQNYWGASVCIST